MFILYNIASVFYLITTRYTISRFWKSIFLKFDVVVYLLQLRLGRTSSRTEECY